MKNACTQHSKKRSQLLYWSTSNRWTLKPNSRLRLLNSGGRGTKFLIPRSGELRRTGSPRTRKLTPSTSCRCCSNRGERLDWEWSHSGFLILKVLTGIFPHTSRHTTKKGMRRKCKLSSWVRRFKNRFRPKLSTRRTSSWGRWRRTWNTWQGTRSLLINQNSDTLQVTWANSTQKLNRKLTVWRSVNDRIRRCGSLRTDYRSWNHNFWTRTMFLWRVTVSTKCWTKLKANWLIL